MNNRIPIKLTYPEHEWIFLEELAKNKGANNFQDYLKEHLIQLAKKCPVELAINSEEKISRNYIVPPNICNKLIALANQRKIPLGALVRWYVADPLLIEHYNNLFKLQGLP